MKVSEPNMTPLAGTISAKASLVVKSGEIPAVTDLSSDQARMAEGTTVTISGCNFKDVTAVDFGTAPAKTFKVDNSGVITAVSPAGTGVANVVVHTASAASVTNAVSQFTYGKS
ncbi:MAG: IPT/TIG domain-containing protein [Acidimicrobiales bacterium]